MRQERRASQWRSDFTHDSSTNSLLPHESTDQARANTEPSRKVGKRPEGIPSGPSGAVDPKRIGEVWAERNEKKNKKKRVWRNVDPSRSGGKPRSLWNDCNVCRWYTPRYNIWSSYIYISLALPFPLLLSSPPSLSPSLLLVVRLARVPFFSARDSLALPVERNSIQFLLPSVGGRFVGFDFFVILAVFSRINYVTTSWVIKRRTH